MLQVGMISNEFLRRLLLHAICPSIVSLRIDFIGIFRDLDYTLPRHSDVNSESTGFSPFRRSFDSSLVEVQVKLTPLKYSPVIAPAMARHLHEIIIVIDFDSNAVAVDTTAFLRLFDRHRSDAASTIITNDSGYSIEFHD
jgi:hypothetical protein